MPWAKRRIREHAFGFPLPSQRRGILYTVKRTRRSGPGKTQQGRTEKDLEKRRDYTLQRMGRQAQLRLQQATQHHMWKGSPVPGSGGCQLPKRASRPLESCPKDCASPRASAASSDLSMSMLPSNPTHAPRVQGKEIKPSGGEGGSRAFPTRCLHALSLLLSLDL